MLEVDHYRFQADRARRMADRVTDSLVREKLLEMATEFGRYAALIEAKAREKLTQAVTA
jgi:methylaspartate ammonia-lyase